MRCKVNRKEVFVFFNGSASSDSDDDDGRWRWRGQTMDRRRGASKTGGADDEPVTESASGGGLLELFRPGSRR